EKPAGTLGMVQYVDTEPKEVTEYDQLFRTRTGPDGKVIKKEGVDPYFNNLPQEKWPERGNKLTLISTEIFQSINPFFVVLLTPVVVGFFGFLRKRKAEPSTPAKIGFGLLISALSTLVMVGAVWAGDNGLDKSAGW